jgi:hypothetical protein
MKTQDRSLEPSDEATREGLRLAREAGDAYRRMVKYFIEHVATTGATAGAGDYTIGVAIEEAEPLYRWLDGKPQLREPFREANAHLEVVVMDAADGRFLPYLDVSVTMARDGQDVGSYTLPFLWHPTMFHYGANVHVPAAGRYTATVFVEPPTFPRHDKVNGDRYRAPVRVRFEDLEVKPGRK